MTRSFVKMNGLGNDFAVVQAPGFAPTAEIGGVYRRPAGARSIPRPGKGRKQKGPLDEVEAAKHPFKQEAFATSVARAADGAILDW